MGPEIALLVAGIVSAISGLIGGLATNASVKKTNEANLANQEKINSDNLENQWKMWNATNKYNTPQEQMLRYKEAGLNPHLVYGQSNTTSAMNLGTSVAYNQQASNFDFLGSSLQPLMSAIAQMPGLKGQQLDNDAKGWNNKFLEDTFDDRVRLTKNQSDYAEKQLTIIGYQIEDRDIDKAIKTTKKLMDELNYKVADAEWKNREWMIEMGLPDGLEPKYVILFSMLGAFFKQLTGKVFSFRDLAGNLGGFLKDFQENFKK